MKVTDEILQFTITFASMYRLDSIVKEADDDSTKDIQHLRDLSEEKRSELSDIIASSDRDPHHDLGVMLYETYSASEVETVIGIPGVCVAGPEDFEIENDGCVFCKDYD